MWLRNIICSVVMLLSLAVEAQRIVYVDVQKNKLSYPDKDFFFAKVEDNRTKHRDVGHIYAMDRHTECEARLKQPLSQELFSFLKQVYPNSAATYQLLMVVNKFEIGHILSERDTGFVELNLDFYRLKKDSVFFICHYVNRLAEAPQEVTSTHSNRMKRAVFQAVNYMEQHKNDNLTQGSGIMTKTKPAPRDSFFSKRKPFQYSHTVLTKQDSIDTKNNYSTSRFKMLGLFSNVCTSSWQIGVSASYLWQIKKFPKLLIGINGNYSKIKFIDTYLPAYTTYRMWTTDFGIRLIRQIKNAFFFNFNPHLLIGRETYSTLIARGYTEYLKGDEHTLAGLQLDFGVLIMPPRKNGVYFGADLIFRITNSETFDSDAGFKLNLGAKF